ncbi:PREDICTED: uncharacterized protein LOC104592353 [Nelumbo nucifera]|uniref:Uncharacterized protein LOC104592353 n=1 Tax=Nelumbo nucifera TaxID=4432 RepID=A0A1U7ZN30_NELNU|nr:PREDICTED: uncharacterized protein LOC104592353 [Nelumbo nucifera]
MAIMRFKKGSKVEVLSKKEVPSGSWRCAEIISGNGHNYDVKYDLSSGITSEAIVERVSRRSIRPCPPQAEGADNWVPGNLVEVFDNSSWKIAVVSKVVSGNYFFVRLLGSSREFRVHKSDLRVRQSWQDDKWIVVGKVSGNCKDGKLNKLSTLKYCQKSSFQFHELQKERRAELHAGDDCFPVEDNIGFRESHMVSSRTLKRGSPYCSSYEEVYAGKPHKIRAVEKGSRCQRLISSHPSSLHEKVDAVASPQELMGEKYMHASFNNRTTGFSEMELQKGKQNGGVKCFLQRSLESNDAESSACSVGSCSANSISPYTLYHQSFTDPSEDRESHSGDAQSSCGWGYEKKYSLPMKEEMTAEVHKLELHAYRCTMEALYASGSLSWEQEALLTNLRLMLHISNDEHLKELRSLVSSEANFPIS